MAISMMEAGARVMLHSTNRMLAGMEQRRAASEFNNASAAFLGTPSASNWVRLLSAMEAHQDAKFVRPTPVRFES